MKNIIRKFLLDRKGVAFTWIIILLTIFFVMLIWAATYDTVKMGMEYSRAEYPDDAMRPFFEMIYDYFPLWLLLGLTLFGFSESQRPS
jgi:hypothetical protein